MIKPAAGQKYDDFQLAYALDLLRGKMTVAAASTAPDKSVAALGANADSARAGTQVGR